MIVLSSKASCHLSIIVSFSNVFLSVMVRILLFLFVFSQYHKMITTKLGRTLYSSLAFTYSALVLAVLISSLLATWNIMNHRLRSTKGRAYYFIITGSITVLILCAIMVMNIKLLVYIKKIPTVDRKAKKQFYKKYVTMTVVLMSISMAVCFIPLVVLFYLSGISLLRNNHKILKMVPWYNVPILLNSGLNSLIYTTRTKTIRAFYRKKMRYYSNIFTPNIRGKGVSS